MTELRRTFRQWWQIPRRVSDRPEERTVSFLELFYDLVYVVLIAQIAHALAGHVDLAGFGQFMFLFIIVWWAWLNGTLYHDLHGNNDIRTRVFTFLQMFGVASMAVFAHDATGEGGPGFALSYAFFLFILMFLWWRSGVHDPLHRPASQPYVFGFLIATLLFIVSAFVPAPLRFYLWGIAVLLSLLMPFMVIFLGRSNPQLQEELARSNSLTPSAVERFGLFTIIVLGEVIVGVVNGLAEHHHLDGTVLITAALGMLIAISLWWVYFDFVSHHLPIEGVRTTYAWVYLHLPLTASITAVGASVLNVVEHSGEHLPAEVRGLLVGAIAVALISIALLMRTIHLPPSHHEIVQTGERVTFVVAIIIALLGLSNLETIPLLVVLVLLMLAPVFSGFKAWIKRLSVV